MNLVGQNRKSAQPWNRNWVLATAFAARICLVLYGNVHDNLFRVNFTDIDYSVFSDAAYHVSHGRSPYDRATYRYTPALAVLLIPNEYWPSFGKVLFCAIDILVAWLCFSIFDVQSQSSCESANEDKVTVNSKSDPTLLPVVIFWLANPLTAIISARGNADCLVCASVLLSLWLLYTRKWVLAACVHGFLAVHLKIYPIIYLPSIYLYFIQQDHGNSLVCVLHNRYKNATLSIRDLFKIVFNLKGILFTLISLGSFLITVVSFYYVYGDIFLEEFLMYHLKRRDIRHNFSPYFYLLYLIDGDVFLSKFIGLVAFVPQVVSILLFALRFSNDLPFCWFLTTFAFVTFNKVCTSQYFIWYIVFLPFIAKSIEISIRKTLTLIGLWLCGQAIWLFFAYLFEFKGYDVFIYIWFASLLFLLINCYIMRVIVVSYIPRPLRTSGKYK